MARNQSGLYVSIKAFLVLKPNDLNQNLAALTLAKEAHENGDYTALLAAATVDEVKVEQKSRRVEDEPASAPEPAPLLDAMTAGEPAPETRGDEAQAETSHDTEAPDVSFASRRGQKAEAVE